MPASDRLRPSLTYELQHRVSGSTLNQPFTGSFQRQLLAEPRRARGKTCNREGLGVGEFERPRRTIRRREARRRDAHERWASASQTEAKQAEWQRRGLSQTMASTTASSARPATALQRATGADRPISAIGSVSITVCSSLPKQPPNSHGRVFSKLETAMNGAAARPNGALVLAQELNNHDISVVSRPQYEPRFISNGNAIASRQPDRSYVQSPMIRNQISGTGHRQNVQHRRAFAQRRDTHPRVGMEGQSTCADILRIAARQCDELALSTPWRTDPRRAARCTGRCART